jgi:hypothetical protein
MPGRRLHLRVHQLRRKSVGLRPLGRLHRGERLHRHQVVRGDGGPLHQLPVRAIRQAHVCGRTRRAGAAARRPRGAVGHVAVLVPRQHRHVRHVRQRDVPPSLRGDGAPPGPGGHGPPFLAVLNFPKGVDAEAELKARVLPGFEERVRGRGVVHTGWMPQQHIPRHRSVWCFLNHARRVQLLGGGSRGGVPAGASADEGRPFPQRGSLRARAQGRRDEDGWFGRDDVARAVAAATADGGDGDGGKWSEFLMDLKEMVHSA